MGAYFVINFMLSYLSIFIYCFLTAISSLKIHSSTQKGDPTIIAIYTFTLCILFFNLMNIKHLRQIYKACKKDLRNSSLVNITTALTWITTFWGLKFISPVLFVTIFMGILPIVSLVIATLETRKINIQASLFASIIILLITVIISITKNSFLGGMNSFSAGLILAVVSSISLGFYMKYSKYLHLNTHLTPSQVLSIRFYFLIILGLVFSLPYFGSGIFTHGIKPTSIVLIALFSTILPLYFQQVAIHHLGPIKSAYVMPFTPIFTYFLQWVNGEPFNGTLGVFVLILSVIISLGVVLRKHL